MRLHAVSEKATLLCPTAHQGVREVAAKERRKQKGEKSSKGRKGKRAKRETRGAKEGRERELKPE